MSSLKRPLIVLAALLLLPGCSGSAPYTKDILLMDTFVRIELKGRMSVALKKEAADKAVSRMQELARRFDYFSKDNELYELNKSRSRRGGLNPPNPLRL